MISNKDKCFLGQITKRVSGWMSEWGKWLGGWVSEASELVGKWVDESSTLQDGLALPYQKINNILNNNS